MAKISIIVPVYNMEHYLDNAIDSLINQTLANIEIICIDDCSTDNSLKILNDYANKDSRIKIIPLEQNKGTGYARNIAIDKATGEYIMFLDPDDWYSLDACEKAYNKIKTNDDDVVFFDYYKYNEKKEKYYIDDTYSKNLTQLKDFKSINAATEAPIPYMACCYAKIYKTKLLQEQKCYFSESITGEDIIFAIDTTIKATKISFLNEPLVFYRINQPTKTREMFLNRRIKFWNEIFDNREKTYELLMQWNKTSGFMESCIYNFINTTLGSYNFYTRNNDLATKIKIYKKVHNFFTKIYTEHNTDIAEIRSMVKNYTRFKNFIKSRNIFEFWIYDSLLTRLFSIKETKTHKIINFLYLKLKIKK